MKVVAVGKTVLFLDLVGQRGNYQWVEVSRVEVDSVDWAMDYAEVLDAEFNPKPIGVLTAPTAVTPMEAGIISRDFANHVSNNVKDAGAKKDAESFAEELLPHIEARLAKGNRRNGKGESGVTSFTFSEGTINLDGKDIPVTDIQLYPRDDDDNA